MRGFCLVTIRRFHWAAYYTTAVWRFAHLKSADAFKFSTGFTGFFLFAFHGQALNNAGFADGISSVYKLMHLI